MPEQNKGTIVAVPTSYNIYRVKADAMHYFENQIAGVPPLVVLETLVMEGSAELVRRILMFDPTEFDEEEGHEEEPGEELPGPWYKE